MTLVIQKFGGTSLSDPNRIKVVADHIVRTKRRGNDLIVVVSAMGHTTDELLYLANEVSKVKAGREMDMLLSSGERISMALLAMALQDLGVKAISFTGSQAGIITDSIYGRAKILEVKGDRITKAISEGFIPIIAGFQGVSLEGNITTLGRGGTDTTAVALAAALGSKTCEIYTDVSGVFTADPRLVPTARRIPQLSFEEMLEMAATGGRVLVHRSVEFARNYGIVLHVRSSFTWEPGTLVGGEIAQGPLLIAGVTHDDSEAKVTVKSLPDQPGIASVLFRSLADNGVNVDMVVQNASIEGKTDISFLVPKDDIQTALKVVEELPQDMRTEVLLDDHIARVSLVGAGMKANPGVAAKMFEILAKENINIEMISTSSIRTSCVVRDQDIEKAVSALHRDFSLSNETTSSTSDSVAAFIEKDEIPNKPTLGNKAEEPGTWVSDETGSMERAIISELSYDTSEAEVVVTAVPDQPGVAAVLFRALANKGLNIDMIVQNTSTQGTTDISFTLPKQFVQDAIDVVEQLLPQIGGRGVFYDSEIMRISLAGAGIKTHPGVTATLFAALAEEEINISMISTSSIRISCVVRSFSANNALISLERAFGIKPFKK